MKTKQFELPKEFATKWVEALRNEIAPKTQGLFKSKNDDDIDCYCANGLGYYANGFKFVTATEIEFNGIKTSCWNSLETLPIPKTLISAIVELNDLKQLTFPEIADWIEANVNFI